MLKEIGVFTGGKNIGFNISGIHLVSTRNFILFRV